MQYVMSGSYRALTLNDDADMAEKKLFYATFSQHQKSGASVHVQSLHLLKKLDYSSSIVPSGRTI